MYDLDQFGIPVEFSEKNVKDNVTRELTFNVVFQKIDEKILSKTITRKLTYRTGETLTYSEESEMNPVFTLGKLPESEFACTAFGLPEPPGYEPKPTPIYVWVLSVAGGLFVVAIVFRYLAKRRS